MKKFFQKVGAFFALLFGNAQKFEIFLETHVDEAIAVVGTIRKIVNSPVVLDVVALLPPQYSAVAGDVLLKVNNTITQALDDLGIASDCFGQPTMAQKLACFAEHLKQFKPDVQDALQVKFAQLFVKYQTPDKLQQSIIDAAVQDRFTTKKFGLDAAA